MVLKAAFAGDNLVLCAGQSYKHISSVMLYTPHVAPVSPLLLHLLCSAVLALPESIIQLDLTRRAATSPWGWPIAGLPLLAELGVTQQGQQQHRPHGRTAATNCSRSSVAATQSCSRGSAGFSSFELALLRPADVLRLQELPSQVRWRTVQWFRHCGFRICTAVNWEATVFTVNPVVERQHDAQKYDRQCTVGQ